MIPWRMIIALLVLVLVALFSGNNLDTVSISVGFYTFPPIPLFLALIAAFILGALVVLPFSIRGFAKASKKKKEKLDRAQTEALPGTAPDIAPEDIEQPGPSEEEVAASEKKTASKKKK